MKNDNIHAINVANKYSTNLQTIEEIFKLMDSWLIAKLIDDISHYPEVNKILTK